MKKIHHRISNDTESEEVITSNSISNPIWFYWYIIIYYILLICFKKNHCQIEQYITLTLLNDKPFVLFEWHRSPLSITWQKMLASSLPITWMFSFKVKHLSLSAKKYLISGHLAMKVGQWQWWVIYEFKERGGWLWMLRSAGETADHVSYANKGEE